MYKIQWIKIHDETGKLCIVASKSSQNSLMYFTGIANVNKEMYIDILRRFRAAVRKKRPEKWRTTMPQHTGRFWSRIS